MRKSAPHFGEAYDVPVFMLNVLTPWQQACRKDASSRPHIVCHFGWVYGNNAVRRRWFQAYAALRLCAPSKAGATSAMKRAISSFTCACGFKPTLK